MSTGDDIRQTSPLSRRHHDNHTDYDNSLVKSDKSTIDEPWTKGGTFPFYPDGFHPSTCVPDNTQRLPAGTPHYTDDRQGSRVALVQTGAPCKASHWDSFPVFTAHLSAFPVDLSLPAHPLPVMPRAYYPPTEYSRLVRPNPSPGDRRGQDTTGDDGTEGRNCIYPRSPIPRRYVMEGKRPPFRSYGYTRAACKVLIPLGVETMRPSRGCHKGQLHLKNSSTSESSRAGREVTYTLFVTMHCRQ